MCKEGCPAPHSSSMLWIYHVPADLHTRVSSKLVFWLCALPRTHAPAGSAVKKAMTNLPVSGTTNPLHQFLKEVLPWCYLPIAFL